MIARSRSSRRVIVAHAHDRAINGHRSDTRMRRPTVGSKINRAAPPPRLAALLCCYQWPRERLLPSGVRKGHLPPSLVVGRSSTGMLYATTS